VFLALAVCLFGYVDLSIGYIPSTHIDKKSLSLFLTLHLSFDTHARTRTPRVRLRRRVCLKLCVVTRVCASALREHSRGPGADRRYLKPGPRRAGVFALGVIGALGRRRDVEQSYPRGAMGCAIWAHVRDRRRRRHLRHRRRHQRRLHLLQRRVGHC
jgi:hypothetical protein